MNWGNKLIIVFLAFGALMFYMVSRCIQTPVNLVTKEYYKDEIAYQEVIDGLNKANTLSSQVNIAQDDQYVTLQFPEEMKHKEVTGRLWFYCAAASDKDKRMLLELDAQGLQKINRTTFMPGRYAVKINWQAGNEHYYSEQHLHIQ